MDPIITDSPGPSEKEMARVPFSLLAEWSTPPLVVKMAPLFPTGRRLRTLVKSGRAVFFSAWNGAGFSSSVGKLTLRFPR